MATTEISYVESQHRPNVTIATNAVNAKIRCVMTYGVADWGRRVRKLAKT